MVMNAKACVCVLMNAKTCVLDVTVASTGPSMPLMSVHACVVQIEARDAYARARTHTHATHTPSTAPLQAKPKRLWWCVPWLL